MITSYVMGKYNNIQKYRDNEYKISLQNLLAANQQKLVILKFIINEKCHLTAVNFVLK